MTSETESRSQVEAPPDSVRRWFAIHLPEAVQPLRYELIAGGNSNLTYLVTDSGGTRFVLRRPPFNSVLATAHDMEREWRVIKGLENTAVPVPPALGLCRDPKIWGAPFYVMGFIDGYVQHSLDITLQCSTPAERSLTGSSLFDVLADLHAVDVDAHGLSAHGPRTGFVGRQLKRWYSQYRTSQSRDIPDVDHVHRLLAAALPSATEVTLTHGDYRLGNCITSHSGPVSAVLDWEISTLGDPLADLAYCLNTWPRPGSPLAELSDSATAPSMADGFASADELLQRYAIRSGRDVSNIQYYVAFNHWKYACIVQGMVSRIRSGSHSNAEGVDLVGFERAIDERAALARRTIQHL